ncbi:MAG: flavin reductase family protein [Firmicutes bacterium]|nr:flavin reductase family protein [Bacillota bacterium]
MNKRSLSPQTLLGPVPAALISCGRPGGEFNIITLAWVGVVNSTPPMVSISIRPSRHSHAMIRETGEFVVNIAATDQVDLADGCGTISGRDRDKFKYFGLTPAKGVLKYAPLIEECPLNLECVVEQALELPSHTLFIGKVIAVHADAAILDEKNRLDFKRFQPLGFCGGSYLAASPLELSLGYSLKKK